MSTRVSRFLTLGFVFSIALVLIFSPLTHALDASLDVSVAYTNFNSSMYFCVEQVNTGEQVNGQCGNRYWASATGEFAYNANIHTSASGIKFFTPTNYTVKYNDIIQLEFDLTQSTANNSLDTGIVSFRSNTSGFQVIDISYDQVDNTTSHVKVLLWASKSEGYSSGALPIILIPSRVPSNEANNYTWNFIWLRESGASVIGGLVNVFHIKSSTNTQFDDTDVLNSISDVKSSIDRQVEAQEQANDDANERYEDEKNTINDSKDEAQSSANSMDTSGFTFSNPFTSFFALFTDNVCVSIPTIQGWLHGTESQVCSPWRNTNVRSVLTPVFAILSTLIITGFVIRWLSSGNKEGTIEGI